MSVFPSRLQAPLKQEFLLLGLSQHQYIVCDLKKPVIIIEGIMVSCKGS